MPYPPSGRAVAISLQPPFDLAEQEERERNMAKAYPELIPIYPFLTRHMHGIPLMMPAFATTLSLRLTKSTARSQSTSIEGYSFTFTAASLRPELMSAVAEIYLRLGSWDMTKEEVLRTNALQCRSTFSSSRLEREIRPRLQRLTLDQLTVMAGTTSQLRDCLSWLAVVKRFAFLFDFATETLRAKLEQHDYQLRESDYLRFIEEKRATHPELSKLTASSQGKVRRVLLAMLREMEILKEGDGLGLIQRPVVPTEIEALIRADDPALLAAFLVPADEIRT